MAPKCRVAPVEVTFAQLREMGSVGFPGLLGIDFYEAGDGYVRARLELEQKHMAPNGYLHAGTVVGFADSACGYGCILNLPEGATASRRSS
jgi:1,4-dihydroxy-2-naphthoyl-CoA hydrolase